jgi:hypothetical protein
MASLAIERGEVEIDLVLHQAEIRGRMVESEQRRQPRVEAGPPVVWMAGGTSLDIRDSCV